MTWRELAKIQVIAEEDGRTASTCPERAFALTAMMGIRLDNMPLASIARMS